MTKRCELSAQTAAAVHPKTMKQTLYATQALEILQALRANETRELKWLKRKTLDIQVSFLLIQDSGVREFGSVKINIYADISLTVSMSCCVGNDIDVATGRWR